MDSNWRPSQGDPTAGGGPAAGPDPIPDPDWRLQLQPESRHRIVTKIMDTLKRHLPVTVPEGLNELQKIAVRFEEKIYSAATSQPDYLRKISLKMLSMETKAQGPQINPASNPNFQNLQNPNRMDPGLGGMQAQAGTNPAQSLSMPPNSRQTFQTNSTNQSMPSVTQQSPAGMTSLAQPSGSLQSDMYANAQRRQQNQTQQNQLLQNQTQQNQMLQNQPLQNQTQQNQMLQNQPLQNQTQQNQMVYHQIMRQKLLQQQMSGLTGQPAMPAGAGGMQVQQNQLNPLQQQQQNQMRQNQMMNMNNMNSNNNMMVGAGGNNNNNNMKNNTNNMHQRRMQQMSQQNQNLSQFQNQQPMQQQQQGGNNNNMMQLQQQQGSAAMLQTQNGGNNNNNNNNNDNNNNINNNNVTDEQKQFMQQQQRVIQDVASSPASIDSTAQTGPNELALEEVYQKLKSMKEKYLMDLNVIYQRFSMKLHQIDSALMEDPKAAEQIKKMKNFKTALERLLNILQLNKQTLQHQVNMKEKLNTYEEQILSILQNQKKQIPPAQRPQPPAQQPQIPPAQQPDPQLHSENQNHQMQQGNNFNMQNDQIQPNAFNTMNGMNPPQTVSTGTSMMMSHSGTMMAQQNLGLKQQQQEAAAQQQQRFIQQNQMKQRHMQQMLQKQQLLQQHLPSQQQIQQQPKQQNINNNSQPNNDSLTDINPRQAGLKPNNSYQPLYPGMNSRTGYFHPQLKPGTNLPISSPQQNLQSSSSPSPHIDQVKLERAHLQPASSPVAPSPLIPDETRPVPNLHNNSSPLVQLGQTGQVPSQSIQSLAVGTPGISASPLLAEFTSTEAGQTGHHVSSRVNIKSTVAETPIERLAKALRAGANGEMHNLIRSAITDIGSLVSMVDRVAGSAPGNGSRAAVGDDLAAITKCRIQAKNLPVPPDGQQQQPATKKMRRDTTAVPLNGVNGSGWGGMDEQSDATSRVRMNHGLMEEIKEINSRLIDTELTLTEEESASSSTASSASSEGTVIKCIYTAVAISPSLRSHFASSQLSPVLPLGLLVPSGYPECSPIILDKLPEEQSRDFDDLSTKVRSRFSAWLRSLSQPMSLKEIAKTWDACAREVILEYAKKIGGGSFSSSFGTWKSCVGA